MAERGKQVDLKEASNLVLNELKDLKIGDDAPVRTSLVIPDEFLCPITEELMSDPVLLETGETYNRAAIQKWFHKGHNTCPQTKTVLSTINVTPNHLLRRLISTWCADKGLHLPKPDYKDAVTLADATHLNSLLDKLSSQSPSDRKQAAGELRLLTKWEHPFRAYFHDVPNPIQRLLHPLHLGRINLQEDLITTVLNISLVDEEIKKSIVEDPMVLSLIIKSLEHGNIHTKANAAAILFSLSSVDLHKVIIGHAGALQPLVALLADGHPTAIRDAATAIYKLCCVSENKEKAVSSGTVPIVLRHIMDGILVPELLCILVLLSSDLKAVDEMSKLGAVACLLKTIREVKIESHCVKENCVKILYAIVSNDWEKLKEIRQDDLMNFTISKLVCSGNSTTRILADDIVQKLYN